MIAESIEWPYPCSRCAPGQRCVPPDRADGQCTECGRWWQNVPPEFFVQALRGETESTGRARESIDAAIAAGTALIEELGRDEARQDDAVLRSLRISA